jgi:hypothetical protein
VKFYHSNVLIRSDLSGLKVAVQIGIGGIREQLDKDKRENCEAIGDPSDRLRYERREWGIP